MIALPNCGKVCFEFALCGYTGESKISVGCRRAKNGFWHCTTRVDACLPVPHFWAHMLRRIIMWETECVRLGAFFTVQICVWLRKLKTYPRTGQVDFSNARSRAARCVNVCWAGGESKKRSINSGSKTKKADAQKRLRLFFATLSSTQGVVKKSSSLCLTMCDTRKKRSLHSSINKMLSKRIQADDIAAIIHEIFLLGKTPGNQFISNFKMYLFYGL